MILNYSLFWLIAFVCQILLLSYSSKNIFNNLYSILHRIFRNDTTVVYIVSFIFLPGTFIHELCHAMTTVLLGGRVSKFSVWPKVENGAIKMGYAEVEVLDIFRNSLIGTSPLIFGVVILYYLGSIFQSSTLTLQIIFAYIIFQVANSMFLSPSDVKEFNLLFLISISVLAIFYLVNFYYMKLDFLPQDLNFLKTSIYLEKLQSINLMLVLPLILNFVILIISKLTNKHR